MAVFNAFSNLLPLYSLKKRFFLKRSQLYCHYIAFKKAVLMLSQLSSHYIVGNSDLINFGIFFAPKVFFIGDGSRNKI